MTATALIVARWLLVNGKPSHAMVEGQVIARVPSASDIVRFVFAEFGLFCTEREADRVCATLLALEK